MTRQQREYANGGTYSLTGGDLEDLGGKANGALDTELLVLGTVDQVIGDCNGFVQFRLSNFKAYYSHTSPSS